MATFAQRFQAFGDSLINKVATPAQLLRLGQAIAWEAGFLEGFNAMTQGQKVEWAMQRIRQTYVDKVKRYDEVVASEAAKATAAAAVDTEFAEGP